MIDVYKAALVADDVAAIVDYRAPTKGRSDRRLFPLHAARRAKPKPQERIGKSAS